MHPVHAAGVLRTKGERDLAIEALLELLGREPYHIDGLNHLVTMLSRPGLDDTARPFRRRLHELRCIGAQLPESEHSAIIDYLEATHGVGPIPKRMPVSLVRATFEGLADFYDWKLRAYLHYRAPELVAEAIRKTERGRDHGLDVLDLGCGTGLMGDYLRTIASHLTGVDVSQRMLQRARERDLYDELIEADFVSWLEGKRHRYDVIVASDVLCYTGALGPIFELVRSRLGSRGRFVFTAEKSDSEDVALRLTERYVHHERHIRATAALHQFEVAHLVERSLRTQNGRPVDGLVVTLERPSVASPPLPSGR